MMGITPDPAPSPLDDLLSTELVDMVTNAIAVLGDQCRIVILLYFLERLTLKEIGKVLELSESRTSQVKTKSLRQMRDYLRKVYKCEAA